MYNFEINLNSITASPIIKLQRRHCLRRSQKEGVTLLKILEFDFYVYLCLNKIAKPLSVMLK